MFYRKKPKEVTSNGYIPISTQENYTPGVYPDTIWEMSLPKCDGSVALFPFVISPFKYNSIDQTLAFVDSVKFEFSTSQFVDITNKSQFVNSASLQLALQHIENKDEIFNFRAKELSPLSKANNKVIDYVIVTPNVLKESFRPLLDWKRTKGLRAEMVTTETIDSTISEPTRLLRIKKYLENLSKNNSLKFALLAGDSCYIPVRQCRTNYRYYTQEELYIPFNFSSSDLFYACFGGAYDWNGNGNSVYGETTDNIDFNPSIFVTRIPSLTPNDADIIVERILEYEQAPRWQNNMLMAGNLIADYMDPDSTISDSDAIGSNLLETSIAPNWDGEVKSFFDTRTDFEGNENYDLSKENFQDQLSKGYSFVSMISHGGVAEWRMEIGEDSIPCYKRPESSTLINPFHTIITTMSCMTNFFDFVLDYPPGGNPCLSESLFKNPNSGVVAYLGSSREGWFYRQNNAGPSFEYESAFYKHLFSNDLNSSSFGELVTHAKLDLVNLCNYENKFRNLQFSLNPLGDPEMPIFTSVPKNIDKPSIEVKDYCLSVSNATKGFKIVLTENGPDRKLLGQGNDSISIGLNELPEFITICVTGKNYVPRVLNGYYTKNNSLSNLQLDDYEFVIVGGDNPNSACSIDGISTIKSPLIRDIQLKATDRHGIIG